MPIVRDTLLAPLRAISGAWQGAWAGLIGDQDTREKFGFLTRGTEGQKSPAGRVLDDYAGRINGAKWGARLTAGVGMLAGAGLGLLTLATAASIGGFILGGAVLLAAPFLLGALTQPIGKYAGGFVGGVVGFFGGAVVGAFNSVLQRGAYEAKKAHGAASPAPAVSSAEKVTLEKPSAPEAEKIYTQRPDVNPDPMNGIGGLISSPRSFSTPSPEQVTLQPEQNKQLNWQQRIDRERMKNKGSVALSA